MKKYYLYLDESGDFDKDLDPASWKNASLVGGFLWAGDSGLNKNALLNKIREIYTDGEETDGSQKNAKVTRSGSKKKTERHATEIDRDKKGLLVYEMLTAAKKFPLEFVIFGNDMKKKIVTSTATYLTVLTEGLIQLLKTLVILENDSVELAVVAGFKKDTTQKVTSSYIEGYIPEEDYEGRLLEKLTLEKAKLKGEEFQNSRIFFKLADDKRDDCLILCDYICNFWYTKQAKTFGKTIEHKGRHMTIREAVEELYEEDYIFQLFRTEENDYVLRMLQDGFYADALFEVCAGNLSEAGERRILQSFLKLRPKQIHRQLDTLEDYIGDLMTFNQIDELAGKVLERVFKMYQYLRENHAEDVKFYLDIQIYRLAYFNYMQQLDKMEEIFREIEPHIASYTLQTLDMDLLLYYYTRKAVYLQDVDKLEESCKVCDDMELLLGMVEEALRSNDCTPLEGELKSEQLGKVLGTKLQAQIRLCMEKPELCAEARETSDRAIAQFTYAIDLNRQYQYRAELEAVSGDHAAAFEWLEKSFGNKAWQVQISGGDRSIYDVYNLLFIAAFSKEMEPELSVEIANQVYETCKRELQENTHKGLQCRFLAGYSLVNHKRYHGRGVAILEKLVKELEAGESREEALLQAAKLTLKGENSLTEAFL